jgi:hypothetical protein
MQLMILFKCEIIRWIDNKYMKQYKIDLKCMNTNIKS